MPDESVECTLGEGATGQEGELRATGVDSGTWRQDIIRQALAVGSNDEADAAAAAAAAAKAMVGALQALFEKLEPLLGSRAMRALYGRSLYLARSSFSQPVGLPDNGQHFLDPLLADLASRNLENARQASETLLVTFSDLLITFLGEPIALRALRSAWGGTATTVATRDKPE